MRIRSLLVAFAAMACAMPAVAFAVPLLFESDLQPLNNSGVSGSAQLTLDGDSLTVEINATGLEPNQPHAQHIHGRFDADGNPMDSFSPTLAQDTDGDGFVELLEGLVTYGPIIVPLTSPPGGALEDFPTAPAGTIDFSQTYDLTDPTTFAGGFDMADLMPLDFREFVLHGLTVPASEGIGTDGEVDGTAGYKGVLPVASGTIVAVQSVPEPSSVVLLMLGFAAVLLSVRLRSTSHGEQAQTGA